MQRAYTFLLGLALVASVAGAETNWSAGIREGGGGFYLSAPEQHFHLNFLGYGQFVGSVLSKEYDVGGRADSPFGFSLRRARFSALATVHRTFEFLLEMGTPTVRPGPSLASYAPGVPGVGGGGGGGGGALPTTYTTSAPDFGLVEARLTSTLFDEWLQLRIGKFVGPFSQENLRAAKNLDVVERMSMLNSLHTHPALDTQIGAMLFGRVLNGVLNYYFGLFNGNSDSAGTGNDSNGHKEFQAKVTIQPHKSVTFGVGYDYNKTNLQLMSLVDHAFVPVVSGGVQGVRHGIDVDLDLNIDWFSLKTEWMYFTFPDSFGVGYIRNLYGAYLQLGFQAWGDPSYGFQFISRYEYTAAQSGELFPLHSLVFGFNIFINSNVKNMVNYIMEVNTSSSSTGPYASRDIKHILLNQLQVKF